VVVDRGLGSVGLLGMSFLNRLEMRRDGEKMELIRRF
jgi:predicted aspartyl protease